MEEINGGSSYFACWSLHSQTQYQHNNNNRTKKVGICNFKWIAGPFQSIELKLKAAKIAECM